MIKRGDVKSCFDKSKGFEVLFEKGAGNGRRFFVAAYHDKSGKEVTVSSDLKDKKDVLVQVTNRSFKRGISRKVNSVGEFRLILKQISEGEEVMDLRVAS
jgi:NAD/NADP transhydrogenase alpha subunit